MPTVNLDPDSVATNPNGWTATDVITRITDNNYSTVHTSPTNPVGSYIIYNLPSLPSDAITTNPVTSWRIWLAMSIGGAAGNDTYRVKTFLTTSNGTTPVAGITDPGYLNWSTGASYVFPSYLENTYWTSATYGLPTNNNKSDWDNMQLYVEYDVVTNMGADGNVCYLVEAWVEVTYTAGTSGTRTPGTITRSFVLPAVSAQNIPGEITVEPATILSSAWPQAPLATPRNDTTTPDEILANITLPLPDATQAVVAAPDTIVKESGLRVLDPRVSGSPLSVRLYPDAVLAESGWTSPFNVAGLSDGGLSQGYEWCVNQAGSVRVSLQNPPANFEGAVSYQITVYAKTRAVVDDVYTITAFLSNADGTTPLGSPTPVALGDSVGNAFLYTFTGSLPATNTKATWDGLALTINIGFTATMSTDGGEGTIAEAWVDVFYNVGATTAPAPFLPTATALDPLAYGSDDEAYPVLVNASVAVPQALPIKFGGTFVQPTTQNLTNPRLAYRYARRQPDAISGTNVTWSGGATGLVNALETTGQYIIFPGSGGSISFDMPQDFYDGTLDPGGDLYFQQISIWAMFVGNNEPALGTISHSVTNTGLPAEVKQGNYVSSPPGGLITSPLYVTQIWSHRLYSVSAPGPWLLTDYPDITWTWTWQSTNAGDELRVYRIYINVAYGRYPYTIDSDIGMTIGLTSAQTEASPPALPRVSLGASFDGYADSNSLVTSSPSWNFVSTNNRHYFGFSQSNLPVPVRLQAMTAGDGAGPYEVTMQLNLGYSQSTSPGSFYLTVRILAQDGVKVLAALNEDGDYQPGQVHVLPGSSTTTPFLATFQWVNPAGTKTDWQNAVLQVALTPRPLYAVYGGSLLVTVKVYNTNNAVSQVQSLGIAATPQPVVINDEDDDYAVPDAVLTPVAIPEHTEVVSHGPRFGPSGSDTLLPIHTGHWHHEVHYPVSINPWEVGTISPTYTGASVHESLGDNDDYVEWDDLAVGTEAEYRIRLNFGSAPYNNEVTVSNYLIRGVCFLIDYELIGVEAADSIRMVGWWNTDVSGNLLTKAGFTANVVQISGTAPTLMKMVKPNYDYADVGSARSELSTVIQRFDIGLRITAMGPGRKLRIKSVRMVVAYSMARETVSVFGRTELYTQNPVDGTDLGYHALHPVKAPTFTNEVAPWQTRWDVSVLNNGSDLSYITVGLPNGTYNRVWGIRLTPGFDKDFGVTLTAVRVHVRRKAEATSSLSYFYGALYANTSGQSQVIAANDASGNIGALDTQTNAGAFMTTAWGTYEQSFAYVNPAATQTAFDQMVLMLSVYNYSASFRSLHISELWVEMDWVSDVRGTFGTTILVPTDVLPVIIDQGTGEATALPGRILTGATLPETSEYGQGTPYQADLTPTDSRSAQGTWIAPSSDILNEGVVSNPALDAWEALSSGLTSVTQSGAYVSLDQNEEVICEMGDPGVGTDKTAWAAQDYYMYRFEEPWTDDTIQGRMEVFLADGTTLVTGWSDTAWSTPGFGSNFVFLLNGTTFDQLNGMTNSSFTRLYLEDGSPLVTRGLDNSDSKLDSLTFKGQCLKLQQVGTDDGTSIDLAFYQIALYTYTTHLGIDFILHSSLSDTGRRDFTWNTSGVSDGSLALNIPTNYWQPGEKGRHGLKLSNPGVPTSDIYRVQVWCRAGNAEQTGAVKVNWMKFGATIWANDGTLLAAGDSLGNPQWQETEHLGGLPANGGTGYTEELFDMAYVNPAATQTQWNDAWCVIHIWVDNTNAGSAISDYRPVIQGWHVVFWTPPTDGIAVPPAIERTVVMPPGAYFGSGGEFINVNVVETASDILQPVAGAGATVPNDDITVLANVLEAIVEQITNDTAMADIVQATGTPLAPTATTQQDGYRFGFLLEPKVSLPAPTTRVAYTVLLDSADLTAFPNAPVPRAGSRTQPGPALLGVTIDGATFVVAYTARPTVIPTTAYPVPVLGTASATAGVGALSALVSLLAPQTTGVTTQPTLTALLAVTTPPSTATGARNATAVLQRILGLVQTPAATATAGVSKIIRPVTTALLAQLHAVTRSAGSTIGLGLIVLDTDTFTPSLVTQSVPDPATIVGTVLAIDPAASSAAQRLAGVIPTPVSAPPVTESGGSTPLPGTIEGATDLFTPATETTTGAIPQPVSIPVDGTVEQPTVTRSEDADPNAIPTTATPRPSTETAGSTSTPATSPVTVSPLSPTVQDAIGATASPQPSILPFLQPPFVPNQGAGRVPGSIPLPGTLWKPVTRDNVTATPQPGQIDLAALLGLPALSVGQTRITEAVEIILGLDPAELSYGSSAQVGEAQLTVSIGAVDLTVGTEAQAPTQTVLTSATFNAAALAGGATASVGEIAAYVLQGVVGLPVWRIRHVSDVKVSISPLQVSVFYTPDIDRTVNVVTIQAVATVQVGQAVAFVDATIEIVVSGSDAATLAGMDPKTILGRHWGFTGRDAGTAEGGKGIVSGSDGGTISGR